MKYVYLLRDSNGFYKIGISQNVSKRISNLNRSHPHSLSIVTAKLVENAPSLENKLHEKYLKFRTKTDTDWYALSPEQALDICIEISNTEEDIYGFKVMEVEELRDVFLKKYREILDETSFIKELIIGSQNKETEKVVLEKLDGNKQPVIIDKSDEQILRQAVQVITEERKASASLLQRKLKIGYSRAARILDILEGQGLVSHVDGSKSREVYFHDPQK